MCSWRESFAVIQGKGIIQLSFKAILNAYYAGTMSTKLLGFIATAALVFA
jgi:hypothetical protein